MIRKTTVHLQQLIKPALPSTTTQAKLEANAKQWELATYNALMEHYTDIIQTQTQNLKHTVSDHHKTALTVALRWAKHNFPRITQETIDTATRTIEDSIGKHTQTPSPIASTPPSDETRPQRHPRQPPAKHIAKILRTLTGLTQYKDNLPHEHGSRLQTQINNKQRRSLRHTQRRHRHQKPEKTLPPASKHQPLAHTHPCHIQHPQIIP